MEKWIDPGEPCMGDVLRLVWRIPMPKDFVKGHPCFYRLTKDATVERVWMRDGMRLLITCACHADERAATYRVRYKIQHGYPSYPVLSFDTGEEIPLEDFRAAHSVVKALVVPS